MFPENEIMEFKTKQKEEKKDVKSVLFGILHSVWLYLALLLVAAGLSLWVGLALLHIPLLTAVVVVVVEAVLAFFLRETPVWLHLLVLILNVALGVIFSFVAFMLLASLIYLAAIFALHMGSSAAK